MWLVVWLAGEASMIMGGNTGMSVVFCNTMREVVITDIAEGVRQDTDGTLWVEAENGDRLPFQEWSVTCEEIRPVLGDVRK